MRNLLNRFTAIPANAGIHRLAIALIVGLVLPLSALTAADTSKAAADAATNWLTLIDAGRYEQSWRQAGKLFRERVRQTQWASEAKSAREPLGSLKSRTMSTVRFAGSLPGAPDGRYAIVQFHSQFAHKASAVETVTVMMEDGEWKTVGYFIR
jgi:hypothetical protein